MKFNIKNIMILILTFIIGGLFIIAYGNYLSECYPVDGVKRDKIILKLFGVNVMRDSESSYSGDTLVYGFNSTFEPYEGIQMGSNVKALLNRLIANSNTYSEEPYKIPLISYKDENGIDAYGVLYENKIKGYLKMIGNLAQNTIELKHTYYVAFSYSSTGVLRGVSINYDSKDKNPNFINIENDLIKDVKLLDGTNVKYDEMTIKEDETTDNNLSINHNTIELSNTQSDVNEITQKEGQ